MIIPLSWEATICHLEAMISEEGFRAGRSFDLRTVQAELLDTNHCPLHNSTYCKHLYLVYQLQLGSADQVTIIVHGDEEATQVEIEAAPDSLDLDILDRIRHRLLPPLVRTSLPLN